MSYTRYFLVPLLSCSALLLMGSIGPVRPSVAPRPEQPLATAPLAPTTQPAPPPDAGPDPAATAAFDRALALLDPARLHWLEVRLWQRISEQGVVCEATGRYLTAPQGRFRLDLATEADGTTGTCQVINDGTTVWQALRIAPGPWTNCQRYRIKDVLRQLNRPDTPDAVRDDFLRKQNCAGMLVLLPALRERMTWFRREAVRRDGRLLLKLSGTWKPEYVAAALVRQGRPWPDALPRQCRLYLDPTTAWPHRFEWWGPDAPRPGDSLLIQMEFRDPVLNRPLSDERCAREFRPDADTELFPEQTTEVTDAIRASSRRWYAAHAE
jgi:hypothetical protein